MDAIVYYSPFGGAVRACVLPGRGEGGGRPDPRMELEVLQGTLRKTTVPADHELCAHIADPQVPTVLDGWYVFGEQLQRRA